MHFWEYQEDDWLSWECGGACDDDSSCSIADYVMYFYSE